MNYTVQFIEERDPDEWQTQFTVDDYDRAKDMCDEMMDCGNIEAVRIVTMEILYEDTNS